MRTRIFTLLFVICTVFISCTGNQKRQSESEIENYRTRLQEKESSLFDGKEADPEIAKEMIGIYIGFVNKYPEDGMAPEYLLKAAEIAMNFEQPHNSINYLTRIENNYPEYDKYAGCLFLKAFVYENYLRDYEKAEEYYEIFIEKYPEHTLTKEAKAALIVLGIDEHELIKTFGSN
jgi:tetratricopeptide (TPR) repeat protein